MQNNGIQICRVLIINSPNADAADVVLDSVKLGKTAALALAEEAEEFTAAAATADFADEEGGVAPKTGADAVDTAEAEACEENSADAAGTAALVVIRVDESDGAEEAPNANETGFTVGVLLDEAAADEAALPNPNDDGKADDEGVPKEKLGDDDDDDEVKAGVVEDAELLENA